MPAVQIWKCNVFKSQMTAVCLLGSILLAPLSAQAESASDFFLSEARRTETAASPEKKQGAEKKQDAARETASSRNARRAAPKAGANAIRNLGIEGADPRIVQIVHREAEANGVPLALAKAVVTVESRWRPNVTGSAGEIGLMQIKYQTARGMGYTGTRKGLYDPATNIRWGMKYLAGAHRLAKGDVCGTVSRYQGGHAVRGVTRAGSVYCGKARSVMARLPASGSTTQVSALDTKRNDRNS